MIAVSISMPPMTAESNAQSGGFTGGVFASFQRALKDTGLGPQVLSGQGMVKAATDNAAPTPHESANAASKQFVSRPSTADLPGEDANALVISTTKPMSWWIGSADSEPLTSLSSDEKPTTLAAPLISAVSVATPEADTTEETLHSKGTEPTASVTLSADSGPVAQTFASVPSAGAMPSSTATRGGVGPVARSIMAQVQPAMSDAPAVSMLQQGQLSSDADARRASVQSSVAPGSKDTSASSFAPTQSASGSSSPSVAAAATKAIASVSAPASPAKSSHGVQARKVPTEEPRNAGKDRAAAPRLTSASEAYSPTAPTQPQVEAAPTAVAPTSMANAALPTAAIIDPETAKGNVVPAVTDAPSVGAAPRIVMRKAAASPTDAAPSSTAHEATALSVTQPDSSRRTHANASSSTPVQAYEIAALPIETVATGLQNPSVSVNKSSVVSPRATQPLPNISDAPPVAVASDGQRLIHTSQKLAHPDEAANAAPAPGSATSAHASGLQSKPATEAVQGPLESAPAVGTQAVTAHMEPSTPPVQGQRVPASVAENDVATVAAQRPSNMPASHHGSDVMVTQYESGSPNRIEVSLAGGDLGPIKLRAEFDQNGEVHAFLRGSSQASDDALRTQSGSLQDWLTSQDVPVSHIHIEPAVPATRWNAPMEGAGADSASQQRSQQQADDPQAAGRSQRNPWSGMGIPQVAGAVASIASPRLGSTGGWLSVLA